MSPKNSKWLQDNLTVDRVNKYLTSAEENLSFRTAYRLSTIADMDAKIKAMIKLIEVDGDSLGEMYYEKRPELMNLLEQVYRGHRALAERYDHATAAIRYAHRTMAEAFPNQVLLMFADDSRVSDVSGTDPETPEMPIPEGDSEEILLLKEAVAELETEKEAGRVQYRQSLDKLSQLEAEISKTREDFRVVSDRASKAENEAVVLNEMLTRLEAEKESMLQDYQHRIANLQAVIATAQENAQKLNERANSAETDAQSLRAELDKLAVEKDAAFNQNMELLEIISNLENKLQLTDARGFKGRAEKEESEVEILSQTIS
ncbi:UNVERIFIED_CONTAM: protein NETWORKED 1B [Sesamum latifolium]|uniref:Protein NETWORKED 1B n=1 Tax=Sesamum latifolium TaxID=2727402 RepID=A0AAW2Y184_9LAMI